MQAIRTEQQNIVCLHLAVVDFDIHKEIVAQRAAEQVARFGFGGFALGEKTEPHLLRDYRMVARDLRSQTVADQVAARIPDMRDHDAIVAKAQATIVVAMRDPPGLAARPIS